MVAGGNDRPKPIVLWSTFLRDQLEAELPLVQRLHDADDAEDRAELEDQLRALQSRHYAERETYAHALTVVLRYSKDYAETETARRAVVQMADVRREQHLRRDYFRAHGLEPMFPDRER